jgi:hypothetical protein
MWIPEKPTVSVERLSTPAEKRAYDLEGYKLNPADLSNDRRAAVKARKSDGLPG